MANLKLSRLRFSTEDDLELLRLVLGENPFEDSLKWILIQKTIQRTCDKDFTIRALKAHLEHLLKLFVQEDRANIKKSGTEEEYAEKERLLQEISDLRRDFLPKSETKSSSQKKGILTREQATISSCSEEVSYILQDDGRLLKENTVEQEENMLSVEKEISTPSTSTSTSLILAPTCSRKRRNFDNVKASTLDFLKDKNTADRNLKLQELELEEKRLKIEDRKIALKEQQFELEKEERHRRLEIEIKEREAHIKVIEQQQKLIELLRK